MGIKGLLLSSRFYYTSLRQVKVDAIKECYSKIIGAQLY
jgi:hypothetical protein